jgi:hypothetical protein
LPFVLVVTSGGSAKTRTSDMKKIKSLRKRRPGRGGELMVESAKCG